MQSNQRTVLAVIVSVLVLLVFAMGMLLTHIDELGHRIPSHDLTSDYLVAWILAFGLGLLLFAIPIKSELRLPMIVFWVARCFVTLVVMLFYESYYALDTITFYTNSRALITDPGLMWGEGTDNITILFAMFNAVLPIDSTFHCLKVIWSFIGLFGVYFFYRGVVRATGTKSPGLFWMLGLFPSILFWSSHAHKDPIVFFGIGLYFYGAFSIVNRFSPKSLVCIILGLVVCGFIRFWTAPIFLTPLLVLIILRSKTNIFWRGSILASLFYVQLLLVQFALNRFSFSSQVQLLKLVNVFSRGWSQGGSAQEVPVFHSIADLARFVPFAMFTSLFRPFPGEVMNAFGLLAGVENAFLLLLVGYGFYKAFPHVHRSSVLLLTVLTVFFWSLFYCFISYQNLGTAVRFKLQVLPLMLSLPFLASVEAYLSRPKPSTGYTKEQ